MAWKLLIDDDADTVRWPHKTVEESAWRRQMNLPSVRPYGHAVSWSWTIARSVDEADDLLQKFGCPDFISFDHDLGPGGSGKDAAIILVSMDLNSGFNFMPSGFSWEVHSANYIGRASINGYLMNYVEHRQDVIAAASGEAVFRL